MKLDPKFGNTYMGQKNASLYNFRQEFYVRVSFLDSFINSATFYLPTKKVILRSLMDDLMKYEILVMKECDIQSKGGLSIETKYNVAGASGTLCG